MKKNIQGSKTKYCIDCGSELNINNTYPFLLKRSTYICKKCWCARAKTRMNLLLSKDPEFKKRQNECSNKWRQKNKIRHNLQCKKAMQKFYLNHLKIDGKYFEVAKRPMPKNCEICNAISKLSWHHWDNNNMDRGLWLCKKCHNFCNYFEVISKDREKVDKYLMLKKEINKPYSF